MDAKRSMKKAQAEYDRIIAREQPDTRRSLDGKVKGDIVKFGGRKYYLLGIQADGGEAYFISTRSNAKYACYAQVRDGAAVMIGLTRMDVTAAEVKRAHGF